MKIHCLFPYTFNILKMIEINKEYFVYDASMAQRISKDLECLVYTINDK